MKAQREGDTHIGHNPNAILMYLFFSSDSYKTVTCTLLPKPLGPTMLQNKRWAPCFAKDEEKLVIILKVM